MQEIWCIEHDDDIEEDTWCGKKISYETREWHEMIFPKTGKKYCKDCLRAIIKHFRLLENEDLKTLL